MSDGNITVDVYPSMQLGAMREQAEAVQMGTHEMTIQPISVLTPFVDEFQIVDFPFLWPSSEIMWKVLDGEAGQALLAKAEDKGFKGLGFWALDLNNLRRKERDTYTGRFQRCKMRVMPSPLLIEQYKAWGANPVPIEYAELYNALQQK